MPPISTYGGIVLRKFEIGRHIVIVIRFLAGRSGGAERIYCELANMLSDEGFRVTCLHFDEKAGRPFYPVDPKVEVINLYGKTKTKAHRRAEALPSFKFVPDSWRNRANWIVKHDFFLEQLENYFRYNRTDLAISLLPSANTVTLIAGRRTNTKVVATNHNVPKEDYESPARWDPNPLDREMRLKALDHAAAIHVLFDDFGNWFPRHLQDRIVTIPNYISPEFSSHTPAPKREKIIVAAGRLAAVKNYLQLVRSWREVAADFPDWKVHLFGTGPQRHDLRSEVETLGISESFKLLGHRSDLGEVYATSSIFCHPAHHEGFGLAPAEALYLKTPVVFYDDCPGLSNFVKDGYNGVAVRKRSGTDGLAEGLRLLMANDELRQALAENGPRSVADFTVDNYRHRWMSLIDKLIGEAA
ncbi:glycosyltransferase [Rhizobium mongolense]|uniref:glycosyltransferase n=1 Tax=Rhizobium mongolense TaxID=57676 RepID=UPI0035580192